MSNIWKEAESFRQDIAKKIARVQIELAFVNVFLYIIYMLNFHVVQLQYIDF